MRFYKGWLISETRNAHGMWSASNYSGGYGSVAADTLAGLKQLISHTIKAGS